MLATQDSIFPRDLFERMLSFPGWPLWSVETVKGFLGFNEDEILDRVLDGRLRGFDVGRNNRRLLRILPTSCVNCQVGREVFPQDWQSVLGRVLPHTRARYRLTSEICFALNISPHQGGLLMKAGALKCIGRESPHPRANFLISSDSYISFLKSASSIN